MEKIAKYRKVIKSLLLEQAKIRANREGIETQFIQDDIQGHYQLVNAGWRNKRRIYGCFLHIDLKPDGKVWIQHDGTDLGIAEILVEQGIDRLDIVLAFHSPYKRKFTGFAVA